MKKLYIIAACMGLVQASYAQKHSSSPLSSGHNKSRNEAKKTSGSAKSAGKTTTTLSRLVGSSSSRDVNGTLARVDTFRATYTGDRGFDAQLEEWKFDSAMGWDFENGNTVESYRTSHTFDANDRIATSKSETKDGATWTIESMERMNYTSAGLINEYVSAYFNGTNWDSTKNVNVYDGSGKSLGSLSQKWDASSSSWINSYRNRTVYASGEVDSSIFESWDAGSSNWKMQSVTKNAYLSGKLNTAISYFNNNGSWEITQKATYTYNSGGQVQSDLYQSWNTMTSTWEDRHRNTYTYNTAGDETLSLGESYDNGAWENNDKTEMSYNSFRQPTVESEYTWDNGQWVMDYQDRYYYDIYFPTSVSDVNTAKNMLSVFPVPAKDKVSFKINLSQTTNANIAIYDMSGKMVKTMALPTAQQYNGSIDIASLPAGSYVIKMTGAGAPVTQKLNIVK
ncbi:MAG: T9SS type A sorting domain-containing protein [Sphingobacteriales bacterium]|nr:MAG: T9SS type A sorting domain-containing protein [Sphingobacteriales bacterium]